MKKYAIRSHTWAGTDQYEILEDFTEKDFERYNTVGLSNDELLDYEMIAQEQQNFQWWISEAKDHEIEDN